MIDTEFPDERCINERVEDINKKEGFLYVQIHPEFLALEKAKNIASIGQLCDEIESVLPDVEVLIKRIFPHIKSITEKTKITAAYLLIGRAYSNLQTALLVCRKGKNVEAMELSRSGIEALDLAMLFSNDKNQHLLNKWFKGKIISNDEARKFHHKNLNEKLAEEFGNEEQPIKAMLSKIYKTMSIYTHSAYSGLLDSIDVFRLNFDFESQAGYHYAVDNFHVVKDLLIKILLSLKNTFVVLEDHEGFAAADKLYKLFYTPLTQEQIKIAIARQKNDQA